MTRLRLRKGKTRDGVEYTLIYQNTHGSVLGKCRISNKKQKRETKNQSKKQTKQLLLPQRRHGRTRHKISSKQQTANTNAQIFFSFFLVLFEDSDTQLISSRHKFFEQNNYINQSANSFQTEITQ